MAPTARARARDAVLADLTAAAGRHLAEVGPAALSVRAVARELGMPSSGVYRYVASRYELLTLVIVDAYDRLGRAVEEAVERDGSDGRACLLAGVHAVRAWAHDHPQHYALLYGTPVPGYAAPETTIAPASRLYAALLRPLQGVEPIESVVVAGTLASDVQAVIDQLALDISPETVTVALELWATMFGMVSIEQFGHLRSTIADLDTWFTEGMARAADRFAFDRDGGE
jgi:AcrR family transcriptional regulator